MSLLVALGTARGVHIVKPGQNEGDWVAIAQGLLDHPVRTLALHPDGSLFAGATNAMVYRTTDGLTWKPLYEGLKFPSVFSLSIHPLRPDTVFAGTNPAAIFKSTDAGKTWRQMEAFNQVPGRDSWTYYHAPYTARVRYLVQHPLEPDALFAAIEVGGLIASLDGGRTWAPRHEHLGRDINQLAIHPGQAGRIYAVSDSGFYVSDDLGSTWEHRIQGLPYMFCECLAVDPRDPHRLLMGVNQVRDDRGGSLFRTSDSGGHWEITATGLPSLADRAVTAVASTAEGWWFAATNKGDLFGSQDFGEKWQRLDANLPPVHTILPLPWQRN